VANRLGNWFQPETQGGVISIFSDAWLRAFCRVAQLVAANPCT
jgi:hypothetical protein